jgi:hypothetical protein
MKTDQARRFIEQQLNHHSDYVPEEFGDKLSEMLVIPEAKMWAYCLSQAIANALGNPRGEELRRYRDRDRFWLFRDDRRYVGSCQWVCDLLGISRRDLLNGVFKKRHYLRANPCKLRLYYNG